MTFAGMQMFVEKLNQLINCNDNPLFNDPAILRERPQFKLLFEELGSMIQTLFIDEHQVLHEHEKVNDLKKRFRYAAEEAQYIVDLFLSGVHIRNNGHFLTSEDFNPSLNLDNVRRSLKSVKVEFMSMMIDNMKMDSSGRHERTLINQSAAAQISISRKSLGWKKLSDETFVGLDRDVELIRDKLVEDQKKLNVVCIVGMGGIGKTSLATKVFNDGYVKHHFYVRVWVTVSQTYDKQDVLIQILESIRCQLDLGKASEFRLRELVHKNLMGKRYLIVVDDIWHIETWDNLKLFFPHDNNGSRILLTSRITEVAKHATSDGFIHHLGCLTREQSWELLCKKVFHGNECPEWSIEPGMQIVQNCQGLPLAVVLIAGVLAKEAWSEMYWVEIAYRTGLYIVGEQNGCLETLALSYKHLPLHLRDCFLYLGGFPENYKFQVQGLILLWVAQGYIQPDGNRRLEDIAEGYLMDLIDRNLVTVADRRNSNGAVKACILHDLVRELCLKKAKEDGFIFQTGRPILSSQFNTSPYMPCHMFINKGRNSVHPPSQSLRSILSFTDFISWSDDIAKRFRSFVLLRVLDLRYCALTDFPYDVKLLVHLRYLATSNLTGGFPSSICNLWNLQTLIYILPYDNTVLPSNISDLVNLRHLRSYHPCNTKRMKSFFYLPSIEKPMNLQTISGVVWEDNFQKCFPCIKELRCTSNTEKQYAFKSLTYLEKLKLTSFSRTVHDSPKGEPKNHITLPATLKTLVLKWCGLPWSDMSIIQSLPNLEVLKLGCSAFQGSLWNTYEQEFRKLKFLRLQMLNLKLWEAYGTSFPCLRQLEILFCSCLEEIPIEIGEIPTLELIKIETCRHSVGESVRRIQEEQYDLGNYHLKIDVSDDLPLREE